MQPAASSVLVVEDDIVIARDVRTTLERNGYRVLAVVTDNAEASRAVTQETPDFALLDIGLRGGSGLDVARDLNQRGVAFAFVTGRSDTGTLHAAAELGPTGFVVKPFSERQLVATVAVGLARLAQRPEVRARDALQKIAALVIEHGLAAPPAHTEPTASTADLSELSTREWEVLRELLAHNRVPAIAKKLHISPATVRNHLKSIFAKVGVHSQQELLERLVQR